MQWICWRDRINDKASFGEMALLGEMDQLGEVTQLNEMTELGIGVLSRHDESIGSSWRGIIVRRVIECRSGRSIGVGMTKS